MNGPNELSPSHDDGWATCEPGELQSLGQKLRANESRGRRAKAIQTAAAACVAAVLVAVAWPLGAGPLGAGPSGAGSDSPAEITCAVCYERFAAFEAHATGSGSMPAEEAREVVGHLAHCELCRGKFDETYPGVLAAYTAVSTGFAALLFTRRRWLARCRRG